MNGTYLHVHYGRAGDDVNSGASQELGKVPVPPPTRGALRSGWCTTSLHLTGSVVISAWQLLALVTERYLGMIHGRPRYFGPLRGTSLNPAISDEIVRLLADLTAINLTLGITSTY